MPAVPHLVIAALLATLAAGSAAILVLERRLRERSPELFRAIVGNLAFFSLLTAVGLGYHLVEQGSAETGRTAVGLHLLSALLFALAVLKVAWLRSFAAIAHALGRRPLPRQANLVAAIGAGVAALAALAGWVQAAWTGRLSTGLIVSLAIDIVVLGGMVGVAASLWRSSAAAAGVEAQRAMRWFSAGTLSVVALLGLSFAAGAMWAAWRGAVQALAHTVWLLAYEILLVAWTVRWADAWAAEAYSDAGQDGAFELAAGSCGLSKREREVAALLCRGRTNKEIAGELFLALQTVKDHNYRIFQKAGVRNRTELARRFISSVPSRGEH